MKKIGIIGAGRIVNWFLTDLLKHSKFGPEFELAGIWNIDFDQAQAVAKKYKIKKVFNSVEELLDEKNQLDLIYVGTTDATHYEYVKKALTAKINVFSEKPLALTSEKARELYQLAQKNNLLLFEGIKTGFAPAFVKAQAIIKSKKLGEMRYLYASHAKVSTSGKIPNPEKNAQVVGFHLAGGMYALFSALAICGPVKTIHYLNNTYPQNSAIQTSILSLRHQNGAISTVVGSDGMTDDLATKIVFEKGYIKLGGRVDKYNQDYKKDSAHMPYTISVYNNQNELIDFQDLSFSTDGEGLNWEIDHVYELLVKNKKSSPIVTPEISLTIIGILESTNQVNDFEVIDWEKRSLDE